MSKFANEANLDIFLSSPPLQIMKVFSIAAILMGLAPVFTPPIMAATIESGGISYNLSESGMLSICASTQEEGYSGSIIVPHHVEIDGKSIPVTAIEENAFAYCTQITDVNLKATEITDIGEYAFFSCPALESVDLPSSLLNISDRAFARCESLANISFPRNLRRIGENAFSYCTSLSSMPQLPELTEICDGAFSHCYSLGSLDLSSHRGRIGENAFSNCTSLQRVAFNEAATEISSYCFSDCPALVELKLPARLKRIGERGFSGCKSLKKASFPESLEEIGERCFSNCTGIAELNFNPRSETLVGDGAFENLQSLTWVYLCGITEIGCDSFANCINLEWIEIENGLDHIGSSAFSNCEKLDEIYAHSSVPPQISINTFDSSTEQHADLRVLESALHRYEMAAFWNRFYSISGTTKFPVGVREIRESDPMPEIRLTPGGIILPADAGDLMICSPSGISCFYPSSPSSLEVSLSHGIYIIRAKGGVVKILITE